jgi:ketosteroid isomerase-like protein
VFSAASLPAHAAECPALAAEDSVAQVQAAFAGWNDAVRHKDLDRTMAIFSQSIRFQVQASPDLTYARLLANYTASYARENRPQWQGFIEGVVGSPEMVTLLTEWKLMPVGGGDALSEYRGADVFQREGDCAWRITVSLNYVDASTIAVSPENHSPGPPTVRSDKAHERIAFRDNVVRDLDFVFGHH